MGAFDLGQERKARATNLVEATQSELLAAAPDLLEQFPLQPYIDELDNHGEMSRFFDASPALVEQTAAMEAAFPAHTVELYNRLLLAQLVRDSETRTRHKIIPSVAEFVYEDFDRILKALERPRSGYYLRSVHLFRRDLAIARLKVIPAGSEFVDINVGMGRGDILGQAGGGMKGVLNCARTFQLDVLKGLGPLYEPHWDRRYFRQFTPEGYEAFYLRTAEMMRVNPEVQGMYGVSWWYDPVIAEISPKLAFLRSQPEAGGARFMQLHGPNPHLLTDPFAGSPERKALYEAGKYTPCSYLYYWPRESMLQWAASRSG